MLRVLALGFVLVLLVGCYAQASPVNTTTPGIRNAVPTLEPTRATVTDLSVPLEASESDALRPHGFMGQGALGRLEKGCAVAVLKVTDRAAFVDVSGCQTVDGLPPQQGLQGWVARSALELR